MSSQKQSGKAFEFAVLSSLQKHLGPANCTIAQSRTALSAEQDFAGLNAERQKEDMLAADAASSILCYMEPALLECRAGRKKLTLSVQEDKAGMAGDVRDIVIYSDCGNWQIGISAKHQHEALKHSRLSNQIDFGLKWFGISCSPEYFAAIAPVFERLNQLKKQDKLWSEIADKDSSVYVPILQAFKKELLAIAARNPREVAEGLISYLIGEQDFYKVMKIKKQSKVQVFNFNGSLNRAASGTSPLIKLEKLNLPARLVELDFHRSRDHEKPSSNTLDLICDAGWQLSFRLHNASSKVEPSLKFDINLIGRPNSLQTFTAIWPAEPFTSSP